MTAVLYAVALVLAASTGLGLLRVILGPTPADRISATLMLGTAGVGLLVVLSAATGVAALRNVALVLVVLAALLVVAFAGPAATGQDEAGGEP